MVNATEMAAAFDKRPGKWLELPSTREFIDTLSSIRKSDTSLVTTVMGSPLSGGGTWMHEDVALEFARWLSPEFAIWCNDRGESYNLPTQRAMELKLFEIKKTSITQPDGTVFVTSTTKVTPKGQMYFVNSFLYGRS